MVGNGPNGKGETVGGLAASKINKIMSSGLWVFGGEVRRRASDRCDKGRRQFEEWQFKSVKERKRGRKKNGNENIRDED